MDKPTLISVALDQNDPRHVLAQNDIEGHTHSFFIANFLIADWLEENGLTCEQWKDRSPRDNRKLASIQQAQQNLENLK